MDWKDYEVKPDEGMYEKIERRLKMRRAWRIGGGTMAAAVVAAAVIIAQWPAPQAGQADRVVATDYEAPTSVTATPRQEVAVAQPATDAALAPATSKPLKQKSEAAPSVIYDQPLVAEGKVSVEPSQSHLVVNHGAQNLVADKNEASDVATAVVSTTEPEQQSETVSTDMEQPMPAVVAPDKADPPHPEPYHEDNVLWIPNIILPNDEEASNRTFRITATSVISDFHVHIYNRGGRLIFTSTDPSFAWDATIDGSPVPQGAYVWVISYRDTQGVPCQRTGTVTVVR